jgi:hypothetical protein
MSSAVYLLTLQAIPVTHWAVGESGTEVTCSMQGFLITTFRLAFAFNYESLGITSCKGDYNNFVMILVLTWRVILLIIAHLLPYFFAGVAVKNDFKEEKYAWMEM